MSLRNNPREGENLKPISGENERKLLAQEISGKYGIDTKTAEKFLDTNTSFSLDTLKQEILSNGTKLSKKKIEELQSIIYGYQEILKQKSKLARETLISSFESNEINHGESLGTSLLKNYAPSLLERAKNPKNISDQVTGLITGIGISALSLLDICYRIGVGILKSPKDIYDIMSGKKVYENWRRI